MDSIVLPHFLEQRGRSMRKCKYSHYKIEFVARLSILLGLVFFPTTPGLQGAGRIWVNKGGIQGIPISAIAIDPADAQTLYVGSYGGPLYKSTDGRQPCLILVWSDGPAKRPSANGSGPELDNRSLVLFFSR